MLTIGWYHEGQYLDLKELVEGVLGQFHTKLEKNKRVKCENIRRSRQSNSRRQQHWQGKPGT